MIGPNADSRRALVGNYEGTASRYITTSRGHTGLCWGFGPLVSEGCDLYKENWKKNRIAEVRNGRNERCYSVSGTDAGIEGEQGDAAMILQAAMFGLKSSGRAEPDS